MSFGPLVAELRRTFRTYKTLPIEWRLAQISAVGKLVSENEERIYQALYQDLRKNKSEAVVMETNMILSEVKHISRDLPSWMAPTQVSTPMVQVKGLSASYIQSQPLGVVLIIGPWNFPFQLLLMPLLGALAAGNCAVLKPSEVAAASSRLIAELIPKYLDTSCVRVVEGGVEPTTALLREKWDHIFYTGAGPVAKVILKAAAEHLTPVTLELGGKSPCVVDREVDLATAARRIAFGKWLNAGQMCVAPDYILVHQDIEEKFTQTLKETIVAFFGQNVKASKDYGRIINPRHFKRLTSLLKGQEVIYGGETDEAECFIAPTLLRCTLTANPPILQEEIFGPLLPIITVPDLKTAIEYINDRPKPLALYVFSRNQTHAQRILAHTSSGGACVNDTVVHVAGPELPFGGVGDSGMGSYHGKASFDAFSHRRSVLDKTTWLDTSLRYPPWSASKLRTMRALL